MFIKLTNAKSNAKVRVAVNKIVYYGEDPKKPGVTIVIAIAVGPSEFLETSEQIDQMIFALNMNIMEKLPELDDKDIPF